MPRIRYFLKAIEDINEKKLQYYGPKSWISYIKENFLSYPGKGRTPEFISIDYLEKLDLDLKKNKLMIFRLGVGHKDVSGVSFLLVKTNDFKNFFLYDSDLFDKTKLKKFKLNRNILNKLHPFFWLKEYSETSLVNFGVSSGLLAHALLDKGENFVLPVTVKSTFSFNVRPLSTLNKEFKHIKGQVEIDAILFGKKDGEYKIFVIEAKNSRTGKYQLKTLAKHKLVYPILGYVNTEIPNNIEIIPVYLKTIVGKDFFEFNIAKCSLPDPRKIMPSIDELKFVSAKRYKVKRFIKTGT